MPRSNTDRLNDHIASERASLDITVLRFLGHPALLRVFPEYLIGLYHGMRTAGALMEAARLRSITLAPSCPVADRLVGYWTQHIEEEAGHDLWLLDDLLVVGIDRERVLSDPPPPEIAELLGTVHFWILHTHPVAALAYFYVIERTPPTEQFLDWMVRSVGVPRDALRTFYRHSIIDIAHGRELEELVDSLPLTDAHERLLALSATTVVRHLARITERHIRRADELPAVQHAGT